jgi:hypothetical protein
MFNQNPMFNPFSGFGFGAMRNMAPMANMASMGNVAPMANMATMGAAGAGKLAINWNGLLNGTQRTLNLINQAIPVYNQVKPMWNNAKTMFKVFGEFNRLNPTDVNPTSSNPTTSDRTINIPLQTQTQTQINSRGPNFFV